MNLEKIYRDFHQNPELSFQEHRTSQKIAEHLTEMGLRVHTQVGKTGVVGVYENGEGPVVLLRADMDALPVEEKTGLPWASKQKTTQSDGSSVSVMHACGHDVHMTCLLGAVHSLVSQTSQWSGTLIALFQPAEEQGGGASVMVDDGLYDLVPKPDVVLGQHVFPAPAGTLWLRKGVAMAGIDELHVTLHGRGGHGSRPETTIDPVVMAAATIMGLNTIVSREVSSTESSVVTIGSVQAGTASNIIPDHATLGISLRSLNERVRSSVLAAVKRIIKAQAQASGAVQEPTIVYGNSYPVTVNDPAFTERLTQVFMDEFGDDRVGEHEVILGSEDVGILATSAQAPLVYWFVGGTDPVEYEEALQTGRIESDIASNHSPHYAPVAHPTLEVGVRALEVAALAWLNKR